jgi:hypothetical protein
MTDRIDDQLATFYADISQQPLTATLNDMTMPQFKERAARRVFATFAPGTLVVAIAIAAAAVGLAAHLGRVATGPAAPHRTNAPGPAAQGSPQPTPSAPTTTVTFTGAVSGTMRVTSTVCSPGSPAASASPGQPAPGQVPASIEADGLLNGEYYSLVISQDNPAEPGAALPNFQTTASLFKSKLGGYGFYGPIGVEVTTFKAGHVAIFDVVLTPDQGQGHGATVKAVGQIRCP